MTRSDVSDISWQIEDAIDNAYKEGYDEGYAEAKEQDRQPNTDTLMRVAFEEHHTAHDGQFPMGFCADPLCKALIDYERGL